MKYKVAAFAASLLFGVVLAAGCEDSSGGGGPGGTFDAGGFDGNNPGGDARAPGDDATPGDAGGDGGGEGGVVTPPPTTVNDVYVDSAAGLDTNTGKSASPFKTLGKAFSVVPGGAGVHLLDGTYDSTNEGGNTTVKIPADVNVRSETPGKATITNLIVQTTGGNAAVYDVVFTIGTELDALGTTKLLCANLQFYPNGYFAMVNAMNSSDVTISGGLLDGKGSGAPTSGGGLFQGSGTSTLTLDGVVMQNTMSVGVRIDGVALATKATLVVKNNTQFKNVYNPIFPGNYASVTIDHTTFANSGGVGLTIGEGVDVSITSATFLQNLVAVSASANAITTNNSFLKVSNSTFTDNQRGIVWIAPGHVDISDTTLTSVAMANVGTTVGIELFAGAPSLDAIIRRTTIHGYVDAVQIITQDATITADLGTGASPGNNDFSENTEYGVNDELPVGLTIDAQGNKWNASIQSSDATGHYTAGTTVTGPMSGTNYNIVNASALNL